MNKMEMVRQTLSMRDFGSLGLDNFAFVKAVKGPDGQRLQAIHAADGTPLTVVADREIAFATVRQHEMVPVSVH